MRRPPAPAARRRRQGRHTTEAMRKRYRHLYPDAQKSALASVFQK